MSKLVAFLVAAAGASTVSVGGNFLLKSQVPSRDKSKGSSGSQQTHDQAQTSTSKPKFSSLDDFKKAKGGQCISDLFSEVEFQNLSEDKNIDSNKPSSADSNYFGQASTSPSDDIQGCLIIDWNRDDYTVTNGTKWKGTFTWIWAFKNKDKGFVNFNVAKSNDDGQNLDLTGGFYLLGKKTDNQDKWEVQYKKEVSSGVQISSSNFKDKFPKSNLEPSDTKDYWKFLENADKMSEMCSSTVCAGEATPTPQTKRWVWKLSAQGTDGSVGKWCEKLDWWSHIYGTDNFKLEQNLSTFKGKWSAAEGA